MGFFDQPELYFFINAIPGLYYRGCSLTLIIGLLFTLFLFLFLFLKKYFNKIDRFSYPVILIAVFWLPLYAVSFYNNFYDDIEDLDYLQLSDSSKTILRFCQFDHRQNMGGSMCAMFSYMSMSRKIVPHKANVWIASGEENSTFFRYYLSNDFRFSESYDYVLYYFPTKTIYDGSSRELFNIKDNGEKESLGFFSQLLLLDDYRAILKREVN